MYTLTRPNGTVQSFRDHAGALRAFTAAIRVDGLPVGRMEIHNQWTASGRTASRRDLPMTRLVLWADSEGIWSLDGSGVPSPSAVGDEMAAQWAAQPIVRVTHDDECYADCESDEDCGCL